MLRRPALVRVHEGWGWEITIPLKLMRWAHSAFPRPEIDRVSHNYPVHARDLD